METDDERAAGPEEASSEAQRHTDQRKISNASDLFQGLGERNRHETKQLSWCEADKHKAASTVAGRQ